jgi:hypothetical protein
MFCVKRHARHSSRGAFLCKATARALVAAPALIAVTLLVYVYASAPAAHANHSANARQWQFGVGVGNLLSHTPVTLFNNHVDKFLVYQNRNGIDFGWRTTSAPEWTVGRSWECGKRACTIFYNRSVALYSEAHGRYLKYGSTGACGGINLVWSQTPVYEWSIRSLSANGDQLTSETPVAGQPSALFNQTVGLYVVQGERTNCPWEGPPIDLVWASTI